ncbi:MAG: hypothetical protein V7K69_18960 [Nostoc sp.]|uniref:hypothetical protein n=1 Tax=Nostoc sp. TaxID=1180 RepID=UPI002FF9BDFB
MVRLRSPTGEMRELWRVDIQKERSLGKLKMRSQFLTRCFKFQTPMTEQKGRTS